MTKTRLTDEELDALLERVRGDEKGTLYHLYFLALRELKDRRRTERTSGRGPNPTALGPASPR